MKLISKIGYFLGLVLFFVSFALPTVNLTDDIELVGMMAFAVNAGMLFFVEDGSEYFEYVFSILTNVWVLWLLVRFWRKGAKLPLTIIVAILALSSAIYWYFKIEDSGVLLYGFWVWIGSVTLVSVANVLKSRQLEK
ncbi:MAG: hypothetical protein ACI9J3_000727 [Parvicellaceae bacterium]|jgi:hypothetical protein